jgi:hypothetical protein
LPPLVCSNDDHRKIWQNTQSPTDLSNQTQLLHLWLKDQLAKEAAEDRPESNQPEGKIHATSAAMRAGVESG